MTNANEFNSGTLLVFTTKAILLNEIYYVYCILQAIPTKMLISSEGRRIIISVVTTEIIHNFISKKQKRNL